MEQNTPQMIKFSGLTLKKQYDDGKDYGVLLWSIRAGYPRITVYTTNAKKEPNAKFDFNTRIVATFDNVTMVSVIRDLKSIINAKPGTTKVRDCYNHKFVNGVRTDEIVLQAKVTIGKTTEGLIFIAVTEGSKKKIRFDILPKTLYSKLRDDEGKIVTDQSVLSKDHAESYLMILENQIMAGLKEGSMKTVPLQGFNKQSNSESNKENTDALFKD